MAVALFWAFAAILAYVYVVYPVAVRLLASAFGRPVKRLPGFRRTVTVIITAYNEERSLRAKIDNVLALEYPPELLDVLVVSDASSDATDAIACGYATKRVQLLRVEGRRGKTACQNIAIVQARGEIVVFTDATTLIDPGALGAIVENFADDQVGCVAGRLVYLGRGGGLTAAGGVSYWGYEVALRSAESNLGTLIGVSGCLYAVRRDAYRPIAPELISDFVVAMRMREQGLRTVLEPRAVCFEETLEDSHAELSMRVRVALRSINALVGERKFLNPLVDPAFAWQLWSHKLLRYASPYAVAGILSCCALLAADPRYGVLLILQVVFLLAGASGFILERSARRIGLLAQPYYFLLTNLASVIATLRYLKGERMVTWKPVR